MSSNKTIYIGVGAAICLFSVLYLSTQEDAGVGKVQQHSPITAPIAVDSATGDSTADSYTSLQATVSNGVEKYKEAKEEISELEKQLKLFKKEFEQYKNETKVAVSEEIRKRTAGNEYEKKSVEPLVDNVIRQDRKKSLDKNLGNPEALTKEKLSEQVKLYTPKSTNKAPTSDFQMASGYSLSDGLGFPTLNKNPRNKASKVFSKNDPNGGWVMPIESEGSSKGANPVKNALTKSTDKPTVYPAMTISDNSILYDTTALTYIVGRIPVGGRVPDPFPAKMIVGKEVLIANGHDLPGIEGMFFSGYATGDMNLGCVRAEMNSYTFIFDDGRQVSFREEPRTGKGNEEPMAYISDRFGLPCVMGKFVSNVTEFLSIQAGLSGLTAAGEAYAAAQVTTGVNGIGGSSSTVTGDSGKYAMGKVVSGAFSDISKWMLDRQENSFDAVVVPSGTKVSLHINRNILIDYDEAARRVDYRYRVNKGNLD
mgnify:CR=1 FL=1